MRLVLCIQYVCILGRIPLVRATHTDSNAILSSEVLIPSPPRAVDPWWHLSHVTINIDAPVPRSMEWLIGSPHI